MPAILEVKKSGFYVLQTVHGSYRVMHLVERQNYGDTVEKILDGPFDNMERDGRIIVSAAKIAQQRLAEILSDMARPPAKA